MAEVYEAIERLYDIKTVGAKAKLVSEAISNISSVYGSEMVRMVNLTRLDKLIVKTTKEAAYKNAIAAIAEQNKMANVYTETIIHKSDEPIKIVFGMKNMMAVEPDEDDMEEPTEATDC